jgi:hypothetical protein
VIAVSWVTLVAVLSIVAWVPVISRFFNAWRRRRNPISLAICLVLGLLIYTCIIIIENVEGEVAPLWLWIGFLGFNALVCFNFYVSFWWSSRRFPDRRGTPSDTPP